MDQPIQVSGSGPIPPIQDYSSESSIASDHPHSNLQSEFDRDYINYEHIRDLARALAGDANSGSEAASERIEMTYKKKKKRESTKEERGTPNGISYTLMRYPLIWSIVTIIIFELLLYIGLRQLVRAWETVFSWRGRRKQLRANLRAAKSYEEWCNAADALDHYMGKDAWKDSDPFGYYDYKLLQKVIHHLQFYRENADHDPEAAANLKDVLYACLKQNFAGIENTKLYCNTYHGTKRLVEAYVEEVVKSIEALSENIHISATDKRLAFKLYAKNYGRTAFCLSGGAGFGYYHLGVIRELLDRKLLPPIITGTSAGALMGALVCTRTDEELRQVLGPEIAHKITFCHGSIVTHLARYATTGAFFDSDQWCRLALWFSRGSMTFKEAYERTGRVFNVSVIPNDPHSPPKLLNYITTPNCVIWSAVMASAAIPGILNPMVLLQKSPKSTHLTPYNYGHRFKDGSLRTDIPTQALYHLFGVNYTIVSQVNPHIHVFFYANQGSPGRPVTHRMGKGWRGGFLASAAEQFLKLDLSKWLKVLRDLNLLPRLKDQDWSNLWLQKFDGTVTILPKTGLLDWVHIVSNPSESRLEHAMNVGRARTWPNVSMISNRLRIENAINNGRRKLRGMTKRQPARETSMSDDASAGSNDEIKFLSVRRASIPGSIDGLMHEKELLKEEARRRKFLAQFSDRREVIAGKEIVAQAQEERAYDLGDHYESVDNDEDDPDDDSITSSSSLSI
ncbi:acyl transferase/acyl hydrolase/lysophospholipase [Dichotomocladium elegans]|nr:acyl transferase/acyl hydrolase/lysophospholipase [Dichotomocladium elegans]